jgi:hypothetical protein
MGVSGGSAALPPTTGVDCNERQQTGTMHDPEPSVPVDLKGASHAHLDMLLAGVAHLHKEIEYRSQFQHQILQIHTVMLVAILGGIVTSVAGVAGTATAWPWLALLIPIEALLSGIWWADHANAIEYANRQINRSLDSPFTILCTTGALFGWAGRRDLPRHTWIDRIYPIAVFGTFALFACFALAFSLFALMGVGTPKVYDAAPVLAWLLWICGAALAVAFVKSLSVWRDNTQQVRAQSASEFAKPPQVQRAKQPPDQGSLGDGESATRA